ncbi:MAG: xanthine dehydrogenase family protein subunit M [Alphaproteobacteria bacterium]|nr:xanthine dehydrogenase family protein subunit M [Alphaproteobacteria bacterium]
MKLSRLEYARPASVAEAIELLQGTEGAKIIAGGQSLIPVLAFRLAAPPLLVDIGKLDDLRGTETTPAGTRLGARVRWCEIERDAALRRAQPLLAAMTDHVAHYQVRNRGTVGGSLAHADPAAEMPGVAVACEAIMHVAGPAGSRDVRSEDFFEGPLQTVLAEDELLVGLTLPPWPPGRRWAFEEFALRRGDFALAGVAVHYGRDAEGRMHDVRVGAIGAGETPLRLRAVEAELEGRKIGETLISSAAKLAAASVDPMNDLHADAEYRRALVATLFERAMLRAEHRQEEGENGPAVHP